MSSVRNRLIQIILLACIFVFLQVVSGQEIQEQVEVELVQVDVVAADSKSAPITDLTAEDFVLKENGVVQQVKYFYNAASDETGIPLAMSFVIDTSGSMQDTVAGLTRIDIAVQAANMVMSVLKPEDQVEVIQFNEKPEVVIPLTSDFGSVQRKLETLTFQQANTAMRDAVIFAIERINGQSGRKIVVIFSDGMDNASKSIEEDGFDAVRKSDATMIAFYSEFVSLNFPGSSTSLTGSPNRMKIKIGEDALRWYTEISGGQFFSFRKEPELVKAIEGLRAIVRSQYTLAYTPSNTKKKSEYRKIKVECKRKGVKLRYREGYWVG